MEIVMTKVRTLLTVAALVAMTTGAAQAQDRGGRGGRGGDGDNQRGGMPKMLREGSPQIGQTIPNVTIYDARGNEIEIHALKGKHKVIVFGCLT
jgi:cytochrome oxidase Cu insertion factor (SCO1/SenC/PrrC family)